MHELGPDGVGAVLKTDGWADVARWRKAERQRLIDRRMALAPQEREIRSQRIAAGLDRAIGAPGDRTISIYWPFRGEHDLRKWANSVIARGGRIALPVVVQKGHPLEFRHWAPGDPMERGVWNILVPARGPAVLPDVVIAPPTISFWMRRASCEASRTASMANWISGVSNIPIGKLPRQDSNLE